MIESWNWQAIGAIASAVAAGVALTTVFLSNCNAKKTRLQEKARFQSTVMSECMKEYFEIRRDARNNWNPQNPEKKVIELYSERVYGLHFEQYHLFQQMAIPQHVYTVWIKSLKDEIKNYEKSSKYYPPLVFDPYTGRNPKEDFNVFILNIINSKSNEEINLLIKTAAGECLYD
jgi:hypothetical protein